MSQEKNNVTLKVFALLIAVVLWSYVMYEVNPEETRESKNINVTFTNEHTLERQNLVVMEPEEVTISVKVTGKRSDMINFSFQSVKASVDLSGYTEGQRKVPIKVELDQSSKIKISSFEPKEVLFTFDKLITRERPVTIKTEGQLESGYIIGDLESKSQTILLKGPRSWINEVSEIVATVNLNGRKDSGNITAPIKLLDDQGNDVRGIEKEPSSIDIAVPILRTRKLPIELRIKNGLEENYEITGVSINPSSIGVKGSKEILELTTIYTEAVDINDLIEGIEILVDLDLPEGAELLDPSQKIRVSLKIEESSLKTFSYKLDELRIDNLDNALSLGEEEYLKDIQITVKGNKEEIEKLTKDDLQLYIDLNTFTEGLNQAYVNFNLPTGMTVKEIKPQAIEILLVPK